jgi:hypothetical protein
MIVIYLTLIGCIVFIFQLRSDVKRLKHDIWVLSNLTGRFDLNKVQSLEETMNDN